MQSNSNNDVSEQIEWAEEMSKAHVGILYANKSQTL